ncbi:MAG: Spermidine export protein MdtJ [Candidatus Erwinia impunctatus]|nr:Spermidine export protein MdtJ [Culicoides impunctatus]
MIYWILLFLSIACEITGTLAMKHASLNQESSGLLIMYGLIAISYILLSFSVKHIALGVAYAIWEGAGIVIITLCSVMLFSESLSLLKLCAICLLLIGIVLIKSGTVMPAGKKTEAAHVS